MHVVRKACRCNTRCENNEYISGQHDLRLFSKEHEHMGYRSLHRVALVLQLNGQPGSRDGSGGGYRAAAGAQKDDANDCMVVRR